MARIGLVAVVCDRRRTSIPPDRLRHEARLAVPATVRVIASAALAWDVRSYVPFPPASCGRKYAGEADVVDKSAQKNFRIGAISTFRPRRPTKSILFFGARWLPCSLEGELSHRDSCEDRPPPRTPPLKGEGGVDLAESPSSLRGGVRGGGNLHMRSPRRKRREERGAGVGRIKPSAYRHPGTCCAPTTNAISGS